MAENQYKTRVLGINLSKDAYSFLENEGLDVFKGTYGPKEDARKVNYDWRNLPIKLQWNLPDNIHEYSVIIEDMLHEDVEPYGLDKNNKDRAIIESTTGVVRLCLNKPQNMFDPVPLGCHLINGGLNIRKGLTIKILFQDSIYQVTYFGNDSLHYNPLPAGKYTNYQYIDNFCGKVISGDRVKMVDNGLSHRLFEGLTSDISYVQTYDTPLLPGLNYGEEKPNENFYPLLTNDQGDIISYYFYNRPGNSFTFMLPRVKDEKEVLNRLFKSVLYKHFSELFPLQTANSWLTNPEYELPEVIRIEQDKKEIEAKAKAKIQKKDEEIKAYHDKLAFLYGMLTDTGDELVDYIVAYLEWLGFEDVKKADKDVEVGGLLQEDIQVKLSNNDLLIIEVKGVHGTSTDNECAQIGKNILRRVHEHIFKNVFGLYLVNNEMGKEPLKRTLPPFNDTQIKDAENSYRGLAYTYQLFNLYFEIEDGIISKDEARNCLIDYGLVNFRKNFRSIGIPYNYFKDNTVICIDLHNTEIKVGDTIYFEDNRKRLQKCVIVSIEQEKRPLESACNGKTGIKLDYAIPKVAEILVKK